MNMKDREKLLCLIHQVSFVLDEAVLYLDTHPTDEKALQYYCHYRDIREQAVKDYTRFFGPLTNDNVNVTSNIWEWVCQPFPWELEA